MKTLTRHFTLSNMRRYGVPFMIQHAFCCFLPILGAVLGASIPGVHNPFLELGLALGGAVLGVQIDKALHHKNLHDCECHEEGEKVKQNPFMRLLKTYGLPLIFAFGVWAIHIAVFHGDHNHGIFESHQEEIDFAPHLSGENIAPSQNNLPYHFHDHHH